ASEEGAAQAAPNHPKDYGRLQGSLAFQHFGCGIDGIIERVQCFPRSLRPRFSNSGCTASRRAAEVRAPACPLCSLPCTRTVGNLRRSLARVSRDCLALELCRSWGSVAHLRGFPILGYTTSHLGGPSVTSNPATGFDLSRGLAHLSRECAARNRCRYRNGSFHSDCLDRSRLLGTRSWN